MEPLDITVTGSTLREPRRSTDPFPNCLSIWLSAASIARWRAALSLDLGSMSLVSMSVVWSFTAN